MWVKGWGRGKGKKFYCLLPAMETGDMCLPDVPVEAQMQISSKDIKLVFSKIAQS